jgi:hypothetical protein
MSMLVQIACPHLQVRMACVSQNRCPMIPCSARLHRMKDWLTKPGDSV